MPVTQLRVCSVTQFHKKHPGGSAIIVQHAGTDVSWVKALTGRIGPLLTLL